MGLMVFAYSPFKALYSALLGCGAGLQITVSLDQRLLFWNSVHTVCNITGISFTKSGTRGTYVYALFAIWRLVYFGYCSILCSLQRQIGLHSLSSTPHCTCSIALV